MNDGNPTPKRGAAPHSRLGLPFARPTSNELLENNRKNNRKVLVVGEFGILNGGEKSFLAIAPSLIKLGWELIAAIPRDSEFAQAAQSVGIEIHDWNVRPGGKPEDRKQLPQIRDELAQVIKQTTPAIVHFNSLSTSRIGGPVTQELGVPSLGYIRDIMKLSKAAIADINMVDRVIAVSQATKDWHVEQGVDARKTYAVHNGVDSTFFKPNADDPLAGTSHGDSTNSASNVFARPSPCSLAAKIDAAQGIRHELSIPATARILLFVGQIGRRKGVDLLVDAFLSLAKTDPTIRLIVVGQRHSQKLEAIEYEAEILNQIQQSNARERVHFLGRRTDVAEIMREADLLVHPARQEPLGRVLLEAAASGLVIVTTDVGGSHEILSDAEQPESMIPNVTRLSSLLVPPHDTVALIKLIGELLADQPRHEKLSTALRQRMVKYFSVENCVSKIDGHYRKLAGL